ncbi:transporter substrate-binding domain-containing protein [Synechococcus sp. CC9605]|uniref:transporter substrate-binding domain-containing protein n=1 Tax=Synechococcus sp. (strain CC9605) TaxID=110662 RepID=UPI0002D53811|nr:transporter substrate-binding domain-containing protein [Synechococcus sp. CC9605]
MALALACFGSALPLQANELRVGISGSAPFVIQDGDSTSGISLDIWRRVAEDNNYSYELIPQPSPKAGIEAVDEGEIDVLVGPISITSGRLAMPALISPSPTTWASRGCCCRCACRRSLAASRCSSAGQ